MLEGTSGDDLVQVPCSEQGQLELRAGAQFDFEYLQGWGLLNFFGQPVPCSIIFTVKQNFFCLCWNGTSWVSACAHCLSPFQWALRRTWPDFFTLSYQVFIPIDKTPPSLLSRLNSHNSQSLLTWQMAQAFGRFVPVSPCLLYWGTQNWTQHSRCALSHQHWVEDNSLPPQVAGSTLPNAPQDFVSFLCPKYTLLVHVYQNHQVLSCKAAFQLVITQSVLVIAPPCARLGIFLYQTS